MSDFHLHLPLTFLHRDEVRALARLLARESHPAPFVLYPADFYVYRLWLDWAREGTPLRAFRSPVPADGPLLDPLVSLIEEWCAWNGPAGVLVSAALHANVLRCHPRLKDAGRPTGGLELTGFAEVNPHLDPAYVGRESKGGTTKAINQRLRKLGLLVPKQLELLAAAGADAPLAAATDEQKRQALGFIMALDGAAGRDPRRPQDYPAELLRASLEVVQRHGQNRLAAIVMDVASHRADPAFVSDPALILHRLLNEAQQHERGGNSEVTSPTAK